MQEQLYVVGIQFVSWRDPNEALNTHYMTDCKYGDAWGLTRDITQADRFRGTATADEGRQVMERWFDQHTEHARFCTFVEEVAQ